MPRRARLRKDGSFPFPWVDEDLGTEWLDLLAEVEDVLLDELERLHDTTVAGPFDALLARECAARMNMTHHPAITALHADALVWGDVISITRYSPPRLKLAAQDALTATRDWA